MEGNSNSSSSSSTYLKGKDGDRNLIELPTTDEIAELDRLRSDAIESLQIFNAGLKIGCISRRIEFAKCQNEQCRVLVQIPKAGTGKNHDKSRALSGTHSGRIANLHS